MTKHLTISDIQALMHAQAKLTDRVLTGNYPLPEALSALESLGLTYSTLLEQQVLWAPFTEPEVQLARVRSWNDRLEWGFSEDDFANLGKPPHPAHGVLSPTVLVPYFAGNGRLSGVERGYDELLWLATGQRRDYPIAVGPVAAKEPGLHWVQVNLRGEEYIDPDEAGFGTFNACHIELLAVAALHPDWAARLNRRPAASRLGGVWLGAYKSAQLDGRLLVPYMTSVAGGLVTISMEDPYDYDLGFLPLRL